MDESQASSGQPAQSSTPTPAASGSLRVIARVCPTPTATPVVVAACPSYPDGAAPMLTDKAGNAWGLDAGRDPGAAADATVYSKSGLAFGEYALGDPRIPDGYDDYQISGIGVSERNGRFFVALEAEHPAVDLTVSFVQTGALGSISVAVFDCPKRMMAATLSKDACPPARGRIGLQLVGTSPESVLTARDAVSAPSGEGIRWQRLPIVGDGVGYRLELTRQSSPAPSFVVIDGQRAIAADAAGGVQIALSSTRANVIVQVYLLLS